AMSLGLINTDIGTGSGGAVTIATARPAFSSGSSLTFNSNGVITSGNAFAASPTLENSRITVPSDINTGGALSLSAGNTITIDSATLTINNGATVNIQTQKLTFAASTST